MGKKQKEETPNINATPNRDIIQRLNFLYQASVYLQSLEPSASIPISNHPSSTGKSRYRSIQKASEKKKKHKRKYTTGDLARNYVQCMRIVGQKTTVKIDPALKRSLCSSCNTTLIPGSSASVRVKKSSSHGQLVVYTCLHCKSSKAIPAPPTLNLALATGTVTGAEVLEGSALTAVLGSTESSSLLTMVPPLTSQSQVQKAEKKKKKLVFSPRPHPRPLPLFARPDAGHVVFRGNEVLDQQGGNDPTFLHAISPWLYPKVKEDNFEMPVDHEELEQSVLNTLCPFASMYMITIDMLTEAWPGEYTSDEPNSAGLSKESSVSFIHMPPSLVDTPFVPLFLTMHFKLSGSVHVDAWKFIEDQRDPSCPYFTLRN